METKKHGGKRAGAGRPLKSNYEKTVIISFRVYEFAEPQIKQFIQSLSVLERTKFLVLVCSDNS